MIAIRRETAEDVAAVRVVNELAFGQPAEADIVDALRRGCADALSLVATDDGVVGHILFTPVSVDGADRSFVGMGLAPMSVLPEYQRRGVGSALVSHGLDALRRARLPIRRRGGTPGILSALRLRAGLEARTTESMAGDT